MGFKGFNEEDFAIFTINSLAGRMEAIQQRIQPKFQEMGNELVDHLSIQLGNEVYLHIAKHARRTVNPPKDTWLAIADNKRGYKKHPHFQVGLFDDRVFIWFALINELEHKQSIGKAMVKNHKSIKQLPENFVVSLDHTKKDTLSISELKLEHLKRFRDIKSAEFLIGQTIPKGDKRLTDGDMFMQLVMDTFDALIPLYKTALISK